jgi:tetratricopeptide (TPR) repeat protein
MKQGCRSRLTLLISAIAVLAMSAGASAQSPTAQSAKAAELSRAGKYSEALPLAQAAAATLERTSPNSRDFAGTLNNLAQLYGDLGRDDKAEPLFERALAIMERAVGIDSSDIAPEMNNLAALYERQGRFAEAEPLFKRALANCERALGPNHPDVGRQLNNLATLYERQDRHGDSEPLFRRAPAIYEKVAGADSPAVATASEQSRPGFEGRARLLRGRSDDQPVAGDPGKGARAGPSGRCKIAEQSG